MFFLPLLKDIPFYHSSNVFKTIYALSTPLGKSAVALIRISGPESFRVIQALCPSKKLPKLRYLSLREIRHPKTNELLDKACVVLFKGPFSFTGEDMAELHVHGGPAVIRAVLDAISSSDCNVQYAEAGDFSRRSYENGKLDLTQAEGLYDIINAETEEQRKLAVRQVEGFLKSLYNGWRDELIDYRSHLEAIIDFGEDDNINDNIYFQIYKKVENFVIRVQDHLKESVRGELLRHGIKVSIFGLPNVGKSSLLNIIAKRSVSIVSSEPGTTRDIIDVILDIGGFPVIFSDTAGLRKGNSIGFVEKEGIKRAYENIEESFMRICVLDITDIEANVSSLRYLLTHQNISNQPIILVLNKIDLLESEKNIDLKKIEFLTGISSSFIFPVSCNTNVGIRDLIFFINNQLRKLILFENSQEVVGANARHREHLEKCLGHLQIFLNGNIKDIVIGADNLRYASDELGKICGRVDVEEVLGAIFSKFCIGK
ncbi:tRNA modification GTPase TrmE [Pneumocystis carinii B80]|uniref:tRNA modification GTPase TrmE n=1 Tax=Pneumocystis carinii (strain B80) TaxID=1408658 RepID=A0A0W4ZE78_PNEC8|nr:tRNA modification GTPase TrmE [Pneumocystis carinii B80]KTW26687.1 tRNA modification GTPase TrmE [Pneumocystis carinii B80]